MMGNRLQGARWPLPQKVGRQGKITKAATASKQLPRTRLPKVNDEKLHLLVFFSSPSSAAALTVMSLSDFAITCFCRRRHATAAAASRCDLKCKKFSPLKVS